MSRASTPTLQTRGYVAAVAVVVLSAWALVGFATGHLYLLAGRLLVHFSGLSALLASFAVALVAVACALWPFAKQGGFPTRRLLIWCLVLLALAVTAKAFALLPDLGAPLSEASLRRLLVQPRVSVWAGSIQPIISSWLLASCVALAFTALLFRVIGATKETLRRSPRFMSLLSLVFGLPFLAWFAIELLIYAFLQLPSGLASAGRVFAADAALTMSMVIAVAAVWCIAGLAIIALLFSACGGKVQWSANHEQHAT